jgi:predicted esterase
MCRLSLPLLVAAIVAAGSVPSSAEGPATGRLVEAVACASDPEQTYTLYLPEGYDPASKWPALVVMDPRGRSVLAAELFREAASDLGWIVVSSDGTRSDSGMEPNRRAVNALWPEIHDRYAADPDRIYLAGFSGTVYVAFLIAKETGSVAGIIGAGGRFFEDAVDGHRAAVFGAAGDTDFNFLEMRALQAGLVERGVPARLEIFEGGHSWMPPDIARQAVEWMEVQAMKRGLRNRDDALVEQAYRGDLDAAERLEGSARPLGAMRRYAAIARDYAGLRDVEAASRRAAELERDPEVVRALKAERRWEDFELRSVRRMNAAIDELIATDPAPAPGRLARELEIDDLKRRAERPGVEGVTARRVLNHVFTTTSFYLTRDLLAQGRPGHAAAVLAVATEIRPDSPVVWYNLACALALAGRTELSLDALEHAIATGFGDAALLASDADLASVRGTDRYGEIVAAVGGLDADAAQSLDREPGADGRDADR